MPNVIIAGQAGRLEARYTHNDTPGAPIALMLHPHPIYGGTMNNKVVYELFHTFVEAGFSVLRFNFRGVGQSQGNWDRGEGELNDAAAALDWLQGNNAAARTTWVAGFSFGAWIGMQLLMRRPEVRGFVSVSPPANMYDFTFLAPCPTSGLIIQGEQDEVVPIEYVNKMVDRLHAQKGIEITYRTLRDASHYYQGRLSELRELVRGYLTQQVPNSYVTES